MQMQNVTMVANSIMKIYFYFYFFIISIKLLLHITLYFHFFPPHFLLLPSLHFLIFITIYTLFTILWTEFGSLSHLAKGRSLSVARG